MKNDVIRNQKGHMLLPGDVVRDTMGNPYIVISMGEEGSVTFYRMGRNIGDRIFNLPIHLVSFVKFDNLMTYNGFDMVVKNTDG